MIIFFSFFSKIWIFLVRHRSFFILLLIAIAILTPFILLLPSSVLPFFDDDLNYLQRGEIVYQALLRGDFRLRWSLYTQGTFGDYFFTMYPPLTHYLLAGSRFFFDNIFSATQFFIIALRLVGLVGMFYLIRLFSLRYSAAAFAAIIYTYSSYTLIGLYERGTFAESLAVSFLPWFLAGIILIISLHRYRLGIIISSLSLGGILLTHSLSVYMAALVVFPLIVVGLLLHIAFNTKRSFLKIIGSLLITLILSLAVSATYWLPLLLNGPELRIEGLITYKFQDFYPSVFALSKNIDFNTAHFIPFIVLVFFSFLFLLLRWLGKSKITKREQYLFIWFFIALAGAAWSYALMHPALRELYTTLPYMEYIQFPWRFMGFVDFFIAVALGLGFIILLRAFRGQKFSFMPFLFILFVFVFWFAPLSLFSASINSWGSQAGLIPYQHMVFHNIYNRRNKEVQFLLNEGAYHNNPSDYLLKMNCQDKVSLAMRDEYAPADNFQPLTSLYRRKDCNSTVGALVAKSDREYVKSIDHGSTFMTIHLSDSFISSQTSSILLTQRFAKQWQVIDSKNITISNDEGMMRLVGISSSVKTLHLKYVTSTLEHFADIITLITLFLIAGYSYLFYFRFRR